MNNIQRKQKLMWSKCNILLNNNNYFYKIKPNQISWPNLVTKKYHYISLHNFKSHYIGWKIGMSLSLIWCYRIGVYFHMLYQNRIPLFQSMTKSCNLTKFSYQQEESYKKDNFALDEAL